MIPKFRAWVPKFLKMCPVIEIRYKNNTNEEIEYIRVPSQSGLVLQGYAPFEFYIMQSIGLKDANGYEIYEGDVVLWQWGKVGNNIFPNSIKKIIGSDPFTLLMLEEADRLLILGNIYENPELASEFEEEADK